MERGTTPNTSIVTHHGVSLKLHRVNRGNRIIWSVAHNVDGQRKLKQFSDEGNARLWLESRAKEISKGKPSEIVLRDNEGAMYRRAQQLLGNVDVDLDKAIHDYVAAKKMLAGVSIATAAEFYVKNHQREIPDKTILDVVKLMLEAKKKDGMSKVYLADLRVLLTHFSDKFQCPIGSVTTDEIDEWLRNLQQSPRSRNNHRNAAVTLFNFAKSAGFLDKERTTAADHTALARKRPGAIQIFTPEEFTKLLAAADEAVLPFFVLGGFCGLRTIEITRLHWEDVRWAESSIVIRSEVSKTRSRRLAPLTSAATLWLAKYGDRTGRVFTVRKHHKRVATICRAAAVPWRDNALRHSFITYRLATIKDVPRMAYEAGNSPQIIRSNYDAVATENEGNLWFSITPKTAANAVPTPRAETLIDKPKRRRKGVKV